MGDDWRACVHALEGGKGEEIGLVGIWEKIVLLPKQLWYRGGRDRIKEEGALEAEAKGEEQRQRHAGTPIRGQNRREL